MMTMMRVKRKNDRLRAGSLRSNKGFTLTELLVSFILLSIFLVSATAIITSVTTLYYHVKEETYSRQVSDIVMKKIESEISGAKYYTDEELLENNPQIQSLNAEGKREAAENGVGDSIRLFDKTDTQVMLYMDNNQLKLRYFGFTGSDGTVFDDIDWQFDEAAFKGYTVEDITFVAGDKLGNFADRADYGCTASAFGKDVVVVFLTLDSEKYGTYKAFRAVRIFSASVVG